jgi:hypothetical protein
LSADIATVKLNGFPADISRAQKRNLGNVPLLNLSRKWCDEQRQNNKPLHDNRNNKNKGYPMMTLIASLFKTLAEAAFAPATMPMILISNRRKGARDDN